VCAPQGGRNQTEFLLERSFLPTSGVRDGGTKPTRKHTSFKTRRTVSMCHLLLGANRSAARDIWVVMPNLNSLSATSRKASSSRMRIRILDSLISAYDSSSARRRIEISLSRRQSRMILRCRCTALVSIDTTLLSVFRATYLGITIISHQIRWDCCSFLPDVIILVTQEFP